ncbi:MAG: hypothetical protein AAGK32_08205, partial [Actinomycetota bacterium]
CSTTARANSSPSVVDASAMAAANGDELARAVVEHARAELRADHVAAVADDRIVAAVGNGPGEAWLLAFVRGVGGGASAGAGPAEGQAEDVAWAAVPEAGWTLVVSRASTALRDRERRVLAAMGELAAVLAAR